MLVPGNLVQARLRSRTEEQLAHAEVELTHSRAPLLTEPLPAAAIEWVTALTATALPEAQPYERLYDALDALLALIEAAPSALGWAGSLVRYELLLLAELGFGLDLESCAATGVTEDLTHVSPKSGRAVSRAAAEPYKDRLLPLPSFLHARGNASPDDLRNAFRLTGHFLDMHVWHARQIDPPPTREPLIELLTRS